MSDKKKKQGKVIVNGIERDIIPTKMSDFRQFSTPTLSELASSKSPDAE